MNTFSRKILWLSLLCMLFLSSCAQKESAGETTIPPALLQQDFELFTHTMRKLHAGLYRHRTQTEIENIFDSCQVKLTNQMSLGNFYLLLRFVIANIQDGHTSCNMPQQVREQFMTHAMMFPIQPVFIGDKAYLACQPRDTDLVAGTEILTIDEKPVNEIRKELFQYLSSDGKNFTKKYWDLNNGAFIPLYSLAYGEKKSFSIKYKVLNKIATLVIKADSLMNAQCAVSNSLSGKNLQLKFINDSIAILTIKTFTSEGLSSPDEYFTFLDSSFKQIREKKVEHLIIDLRNNGGGHDVFGSALYSYLTNMPFQYYTSLQSTTRVFEKHEHPNLEVQLPARNNYSNKLYILINGQSFSTTAEFCSIAKSNGRALFIGEETGGGYVGNTSGGNAQVTLPNTQIVVSIPKTKYTMAVKPAIYQDRGIPADFVVVPNISDIVARRDVQLNYAVQLAQTGKQ